MDVLSESPVAFTFPMVQFFVYICDTRLKNLQLDFVPHEIVFNSLIITIQAIAMIRFYCLKWN